MNENIKVMYFHGTTEEGCRYTIAGVIKGEDLKIGISICAEIDEFNKAKGRTIASGRVLNQRRNHKGYSAISLYTDDIDIHNQFHEKGDGFKKNYFVGQETKVFTEFVKNFNHFSRRELMSNFRLTHRGE